MLFPTNKQTNPQTRIVNNQPMLGPSPSSSSKEDNYNIASTETLRFCTRGKCEINQPKHGDNPYTWLCDNPPH